MTPNIDEIPQSYTVVPNTEFSHRELSPWQMGKLSVGHAVRIELPSSAPNVFSKNRIYLTEMGLLNALLLKKEYRIDAKSVPLDLTPCGSLAAYNSYPYVLVNGCGFPQEKYHLRYNLSLVGLNGEDLFPLRNGERVFDFYCGKVYHTPRATITHFPNLDDSDFCAPDPIGVGIANRKEKTLEFIEITFFTS